MDSDSDLAARVVTAMDARDRAKRRYEQVRQHYQRREIELSDVNEALISYVEAVNDYHDALAEVRHWNRRNLE